MKKMYEIYSFGPVCWCCFRIFWCLYRKINDKFYVGGRYSKFFFTPSLSGSTSKKPLIFVCHTNYITQRGIFSGPSIILFLKPSPPLKVSCQKLRPPLRVQTGTILQYGETSKNYINSGHFNKWVLQSTLRPQSTNNVV